MPLETRIVTGADVDLHASANGDFQRCLDPIRSGMATAKAKAASKRSPSTKQTSPVKKRVSSTSAKKKPSIAVAVRETSRVAAAAERASATLSRLVTELHEAIEAVNARLGIEVCSRPGPPATQAAIVALEKRIGFSLPPSYRTFLSLHDGWEHFSGQVHFLSTKAQSSASCRALSRRWAQTVSASKGRARVEDAYVIGMRLHRLAYPVILFDRSSSDARGELAIVALDGRKSTRSVDLIQFFRHELRQLRAILQRPRRAR